MRSARCCGWAASGSTISTVVGYHSSFSNKVLLLGIIFKNPTPCPLRSAERAFAHGVPSGPICGELAQRSRRAVCCTSLNCPETVILNFSTVSMFYYHYLLILTHPSISHSGLRRLSRSVVA